jgi:hypothetical protein
LRIISKNLRDGCLKTKELFKNGKGQNKLQVSIFFTHIFIQEYLELRKKMKEELAEKSMKLSFIIFIPNQILVS